MLLLTRRLGQAITIQPGQGADLATPLGDLFSTGPIVVVVNRLIRDEVRLGIAAHADLLIMREELRVKPYQPDNPDQVKPTQYDTLAKNIHQFCQQRHWSHADLAQASHLSLTTLTAIEQGCGFVCQDDIERIAQALGLSVGQLLA